MFGVRGIGVQKTIDCRDSVPPRPTPGAGHAQPSTVPTQLRASPLQAHHDLCFQRVSGRESLVGQLRAVSTDFERGVDLRDIRLDSWEPRLRRQQPTELRVREAKDKDEFVAVAWLRARAYYEIKPAGRFQGSFTKQFAEQEACALVDRTKPAKNCQVPEAVCLIVTQPAQASGAGITSNDVVATADVKPPESAGGQHPLGKAQAGRSDEDGAYILNVVVGAQYRRTGWGKAVMTSAEEYARRLWGARRVYAHVSNENEAARRLYFQLGYSRHSSHAIGGTDTLLYKDL